MSTAILGKQGLEREVTVSLKTVLLFKIAESAWKFLQKKKRNNLFSNHNTGMRNPAVSDSKIQWTWFTQAFSKGYLKHELMGGWKLIE